MSEMKSWHDTLTGYAGDRKAALALVAGWQYDLALNELELARKEAEIKLAVICEGRNEDSRKLEREAAVLSNTDVQALKKRSAELRRLIAEGEANASTYRLWVDISLAYLTAPVEADPKWNI